MNTELTTHLLKYATKEELIELVLTIQSEKEAAQKELQAWESVIYDVGSAYDKTPDDYDVVSVTLSREDVESAYEVVLPLRSGQIVQPESFQPLQNKENNSLLLEACKRLSKR